MELGGVKPNPRSGLVYEGIEIARRENVDFLLAIGGGSVNAAWISVGGLPAWNTALLFKPLYWPLLLLGTERGLL